MYIYGVSKQYFVEGSQNVNFHLRFGAKLQGGKMTLERKFFFCLFFWYLNFTFGKLSIPEIWRS